jgi:hypothetical protein
MPFPGFPSTPWMPKAISTPEGTRFIGTPPLGDATYNRGLRVSLVLVIFTLLTAYLICGLGLMIMWNWYMPSIFDLPRLNFGEATGIMIVAAYLTGSGSYNTMSENAAKAIVAVPIAGVIHYLLVN